MLDWIIIGTKMLSDGGVMVLASDQMMLASIDTEMRFDDIYDRFASVYTIPRTPEYTVTAKMGRVKMVQAATYEEAIRKLFEEEQWTPEPPKEVTSGPPRQIQSGHHQQDPTGHP